MKWKLVAVLLTALMFCGLDSVRAETSAYEKLSGKEKKIVDTVLDEFKKHDMIFLEELSDNLHTLHACAGIPEAPAAHSGEDHKEGHDDTEHEDTHLAARVYKATPDANGKYLTPTFTGPDKKGNLTIYTYKEIHTVVIEDKKITVTMTGVAEGKPERQKGKPDSKFVESLASRLQGKAGEEGVIVLP